MFALYVLIQPWRWRWLPEHIGWRSWLCLITAVLAVAYQPFWIRLVCCLLYTAYVYVHTVNRARAYMGE